MLTQEPTNRPGTPLPPHLLGVINLMNEKPDVLRYADSPEAALRLAEEYRAAGFTAVDLGAQSSHYGVRRIDEDQELAVLLPVVRALVAEEHSVCIETSRAEVIRAACGEGASIVNLSGGLFREDVQAALAETRPSVITAFTPRDSTTEVHDLDIEADLAARLADGLRSNLRLLHDLGVEDVIADAGIGFSYPVPYSEFRHYQVSAIRRTRELAAAVGAPLLVAVPRLPDLWITVTFAALSVEHGADLLRCHDPDVAKVVSLLT
ncbi:dihydropteroate synthase [Ornithinimicrobium sp. Y1694]|uniref:dihydropteroate synthase n=1 Tax=Ornithinimicrobium sp. Y1694 TaxID=3418590 RepID=UPI003CE94867